MGYPIIDMFCPSPVSTYMQKVQGLFHKGQADYLVGLLPPLIYVEQVKQHSVIYKNICAQC